MSDTTTAILLVAATFFLFLGTAAVVVRVLWRENRRLTNEVLLGYRRATMPVVEVPMEGEPDIPLTVEGKKAIDAALGLGGNGAYTTTPEGIQGFDWTSHTYPDPTDAALPNPDPMDGANRVSYGDDPSWPVQDG